MKKETKFIHADYQKRDAYNSLQMPVYETNAFEFDNAEEMADAFVGKNDLYAYSRITNPTVSYLEKRIKECTDAHSVTALNSGMAAISNVFMTIAYAGANIVSSPHLFGNTYSLFSSTLQAFGVELRTCDMTNLDEVEQQIDENTCALFVEIISNPQMEVVDLKALSSIAKMKQVPLVADTTIIPFTEFSAKDLGVNIDIVSSTKYISGGATSLGGIILDYGTFNWAKSKRLSVFSQQFGIGAFTAKLRKEVHRNLGAYMSPHAAHAQLLGLETVQLRFKAVSKSCLFLAQAIEKLPQVEMVNHPALSSSPYFTLSKEQYGEYPGAMLTFNLASKEACFAFLNKLQLIKRATNLFDNRSLIIHPASTIYGPFSDEVRAKLHVCDKTIRLSVGLEAVDDLLADIKQALS